MRQTLITLLTLSAIWSSGVSLEAQDTKRPQKSDERTAAEQKTASEKKSTADEKSTPVEKSTTASTTNDKKEPNEVQQLVAEARKRGDTVLDASFDSDGNFVHPMTDNSQIVKYLPKPDYPPLAKAAHVSGPVDVQVLVDYDGTVVAAVVISGHPLLQTASLNAARQTLFVPLKLAGQPVRVTGIIRYTFTPR